MAGVLHRRGGVLRVGLIQAAVLIVTGVRVGAPLGGKHLPVMAELHIDGPIGHRDEIADAAVAIHHQAQGRGLHPAYGQHALIARLAPEQGKQAAHVHADQPVGPRTPQGCVVQVESVGAGLERGQCLANRGVVQCRQPQALDRPAITAVFDQLAGDHFAFTVGIGGDHQFTGFAKQAFDGLVLAGGFGFDAHLPLLRHDGQVGQDPAFVALVVGVGRGGFEQMTDAPGDSGIGPHPAAITATAGTEHGRNIFGLGGFFTQKQPHRFTRSCCAEGAQHGRD